MYSVGNMLFLFVCHKKTIFGGEFSGCYLQLFDGVGADDVHLCAFVEHDRKRVFVMSDCGHFERTCVHCT